MTRQGAGKPHRGPPREALWCLFGERSQNNGCELCGRRANWREEGFRQEPYNQAVDLFPFSLQPMFSAQK
jgi:hypothetical protein